MLRTVLAHHQAIIEGKHKVLRRYGFLFKCYRQDVYYYDLVILLRKLTFVTVTRIGAHRATIHANTASRVQSSYIR